MEDPDHLISVSEEPKKNSTLVITLVRLFACGHGSVARLILYKLKIRHGIWLVGAEPSDCGIIALRRLSDRGALRRLSGLHVSYDRDTMLNDIRHSIGHPLRPHMMEQRTLESVPFHSRQAPPLCRERTIEARSADRLV